MTMQRQLKVFDFKRLSLIKKFGTTNFPSFCYGIFTTIDLFVCKQWSLLNTGLRIWAAKYETNNI